MDSQQARRENKTTEREIHVEKNRVPKMTTHFEHLATEQAKGSTGGSRIEELQGGEYKKDHAGGKKAIGDVGGVVGVGRSRETHEVGVSPLLTKQRVKGEREGAGKAHVHG
ncbi:hypothetical protein RIF29_05596 [Crotalaria pallida]|uniref:Uncharacterized protein n=1 Tax=Crotalaria pallida TaxID=3830 RepID=A0AAN9J277_CROPI